MSDAESQESDEEERSEASDSDESGEEGSNSDDESGSDVEDEDEGSTDNDSDGDEEEKDKAAEEEALREKQRPDVMAMLRFSLMMDNAKFRIIETYNLHQALALANTRKQQQMTPPVEQRAKTSSIALPTQSVAQAESYPSNPMPFTNVSMGSVQENKQAVPSTIESLLEASARDRRSSASMLDSFQLNKPASATLESDYHSEDFELGSSLYGTRSEQMSSFIKQAIDILLEP